MASAKRVLLKLSGEWFAGKKEKGFDEKTFERISSAIDFTKQKKIQLGIVLGGGNIFRGRDLKDIKIDRVSADYIGMLSTIMNGIALSNFLREKGHSNKLFSSFAIGNFVQAYNTEDALNALMNQKVVLLVGGIGNPLFTTDSTASIRANELEVDFMLKATNVNGVYDTDPKENPKAKKFENLTFDDAINQNLQVMDQTALCFCRDNNLQVRVFNADEKDGFEKAISGEEIGTLLNNMLEEIKQETLERMEKSISSLESSLQKIRTGRANPSLLDAIQIDYYGNMTPLSQVSNISVQDAKTLLISPWEKNLVPDIEKAIQSSDLGINPATSGDVIRVILPDLTEETRRDLIKVAKSEAENSKIALRNQRRDANGLLKEYLKEKEISEDDERRGQEIIQNLTDDFISKVEQLLELKEKDLLEI